MTEKDKVVDQKVKQSGIFNFGEVYQFVYRWLVDEDYDVQEDKYQEEVTGDAKNIEIKWTAKKKISDYFRNEIKLTWRVIGLKNIEVTKDNQKINTNKGSFECKLTGNLEKDYENKWENNPSLKFLRGVYDRYIVEGTIKEYRQKIFNDVNDLTEQIKAFLAIEGMK